MFYGATQAGHLGPAVPARCGPRQLQDGLGLLHKVRSSLGPNPLSRLRGDVEADETYVGGYRPGRNGRGVGKTGVAIAVERREKTAGAARLAVIPRATTAVLTSFVQRSIRPEQSTVFTDAWGSYTALGRLGIDHRPRKGGHGRHALDGLPWAHTVFGNLKTWLRATFPRCQPQASPALPRRVHLPPRPTLARRRALRIRPTPRRARPAAPLPTAGGGGNGIARGNSSGNSHAREGSFCQIPGEANRLCDLGPVRLDAHRRR